MNFLIGLDSPTRRTPGPVSPPPISPPARPFGSQGSPKAESERMREEARKTAEVKKLKNSLADAEKLNKKYEKQIKDLQNEILDMEEQMNIQIQPSDKVCC